MSILGAHVSTSGGFDKALENGENLGAKVIQIFGASPRQWHVTMPKEDNLEKFYKKKKSTTVEQIFLHASYLANLATPKEDLYEKSIKSLTGHLKIAELLGAEGLIYHIGSYKDSTLEEANQRIADGMARVLKDAPGKAKLIMENAAGGGKKIGLTPKEIGDIYKLNPDPRIKVCIDTAHAFGAGVLDKYSPEEISAFTKECDENFGLENLIVLHVNDSKVPFGSCKDRHENIGEGHIGKEAFQNLANDQFFGKIPWILEVPGFEGGGPDLKNMDILKSLF